jgi:hypothetical protein
MLISLLFIVLVQDPQLESYRRCAELIEDERQRLACYDRAALQDTVLSERKQRRQQAAARVTAEADQAAAERSRVAELEQRATEAERALAEARARVSEADADQLSAQIEDGAEAAITKISIAPTGEISVTLEDGSTWRQLRSERAYKTYQLEQMERARLTRGAFGSWRMHFEPLGRSTKVRPDTP